MSLLDFDANGQKAAAIDVSMILTDELSQAENIGVGDELFLSGLFVHRRGVHRNVPIIRTGTIAAMPDAAEMVETGLGLTQAYLAEERSLGGLSGSPVFVVLDQLRRKATPDNLGGAFYLLGLVHGHWDRKAPDATEYANAIEQEVVNVGIAVIVPSGRILDLINAPNEQKKRKDAWEELTKKNLARS